MGRKRGRHITRIVRIDRTIKILPTNLFYVFYTKSKSKHAKEKWQIVHARDELDAYQIFKKELKI